MKKLLALTVTVLMALSLVACGGNGNSTSGSTSTGGDASGSAGGGKQVVMGLNADYTTFDPAHNYEKTAHMIMPVVYDTLVKYDASETSGVAPT